MSLTIRPIRPNERARFVQRVVETTWNDLPPFQRAQLTPAQLAPNVERIVELLMAQGNNVILVADTEAHHNAGQVWLGEAPDPYTGTRRGYVYDLYVEEAARGQGIGRALLQAADEASRKRGDTELGLTVSARNESALALYRSLGFETERLNLSKRLES